MTTLTADLYNSLDAAHKGAACVRADVNLPEILALREGLTGDALYDWKIREAYAKTTSGIYATSDPATATNYQNLMLRDALLKVCRMLEQAVEPMGVPAIDLTDGDDGGRADAWIQRKQEDAHA